MLFFLMLAVSGGRRHKHNNIGNCYNTAHTPYYIPGRIITTAMAENPQSHESAKQKSKTAIAHGRVLYEVESYTPPRSPLLLQGKHFITTD